MVKLATPESHTQLTDVTKAEDQVSLVYKTKEGTNPELPTLQLTTSDIHCNDNFYHEELTAKFFIHTECVVWN